MFVTILFLVLGLVALYVGGELLVRGAVQIGEWLRLSYLVIGLTIVAFGTSAPELAVSLDAAVVGSPAIALANVVGSNLANMALVLGLSALILPMTIDRIVLIRDLPVMFGGFVAMTLMLLDRKIGAMDGGLLLLGLAGYLVAVIWHSRRQSQQVEEALAVPDVHTSVLVTLLMIAGGVVLLTAGGHWLVGSAVDLAARLGMSEAAIGMTIVAVGTSLPEITASLIAVARGHGSMAIGNVVGSNIWNTFGVLGVTGLIVPLDQGSLSGAMVMAMIACGLLLWVMCRTRFYLSRLEGGLLLAGFVFSQWWFVAH